MILRVTRDDDGATILRLAEPDLVHNVHWFVVARLRGSDFVKVEGGLFQVRECSDEMLIAALVEGDNE